MFITSHFVSRMMERFNIEVSGKIREMFERFYDLPLMKVFDDFRNNKVIYVGRISGEEMVIIANIKTKKLITVLTIDDHENNLSYSSKKIEEFRAKLNVLRKHFKY
jgi:hypothetical protein